jgi:hypothetical protein
MLPRRLNGCFIGLNSSNCAPARITVKSLTSMSPAHRVAVSLLPPAGEGFRVTLERVTKPPKPNPHRRSSVNRYGRCAASRSVVGSCRTVLASSTLSAKRRTAARLRSRVSHRHSLCPSQRHPLADAPAGTRVWIGNDVLAARARLATGGRVGSDPLCAPGLARSLRPD